MHLSLIHSFFFQQVTCPLSPFFRPHNGHVTIVVNNRVSASRNLDFHFYFKRNIPLSGNVLSPVRTLSIQRVFIESNYLKVNISSTFHIICKCKRKYYLKRHFQKQKLCDSQLLLYINIFLLKIKFGSLTLSLSTGFEFFLLLWLIFSSTRTVFPKRNILKFIYE